MKTNAKTASRSRLSYLILSLLITFLLSACGPIQEYDLIFRNGTIVDGTGKAAYTGDVAVQGDSIVAVEH